MKHLAHITELSHMPLLTEKKIEGVTFSEGLLNEIEKFCVESVHLSKLEIHIASMF